MAFGIRKSPSSNDPRDWDWLPRGWAYGKVAPYKWRLATTGVTQYFQRLNTGLTLPLKNAVPYLAHYQIWDFYPAGPIWDFWVAADDVGEGPPPPWTVRYSILFQFPGHADPAYGDVFGLFPDAFASYSVNLVDFWGMPHANFPNPVTITPLPWYAPDSEVG